MISLQYYLFNATKHDHSHHHNLFEEDDSILLYVKGMIKVHPFKKKQIIFFLYNY